MSTETSITGTDPTQVMSGPAYKRCRTRPPKPGTLVEINLQREFKYADGAKLDFCIAGHEVDANGDLYWVKDGSQSPLRLDQFVQLRPAPRNAQYTTYFYNRTEGPSVRMVSHQYGPESEVPDDAESFRDEFGGPMIE